MSFSVICGSCHARLKLPSGCTKKKARCSRCDARIDLTAVLDASAYLPVLVKAATPVPEREEDPLPYLDLNPLAKPTHSPPTPLLTQKPSETLSLDDEPLSLDDGTSATPPPVAPPPLRVPVRVIADSAKLFTGPCEVVMVPHGLYLENISYRPFLYIPVRSQAAPGDRELAVTLPDGRAVTLEFTGRNARQLACDTAAFLAGERGAPDPREYRIPRWLFLVAAVLALGLAAGPIVLSQTAPLGLDIGLLIGAGLAWAGLSANLAVVLFARVTIPGKVVLMALVGAVLTGAFFVGASIFLANRRHEPEPPKPEPPPQSPPQMPGPMPGPMPSRPPTAIDKAYTDGVYRFEDGPDEVTALSVSTDDATLIVGYKNGTTRVWNFGQATIDPFNPGPKCDGAPTRIQFDNTGNIVYLTCNGGTVAALWNAPPEVPVKIPGDPFAVFASPKGDRFAAMRGNTLVVRYIPTALLSKPPKGTKGFLVTLPKDETIPIDTRATLVAPQRPTFLAWHPTGKLLAGQSDGSVLSWGAAGPGYTVTTREHKTAVRAWAASPATWDFATGDDKGVVGLWENKAMKPRTFAASQAAIRQLVFSPSGSHLAVVDGAGGVSVWDLFETQSILKITRVGAKVAFGPNDDLLLLSDGKAIELWSVSELANLK